MIRGAHGPQELAFPPTRPAEGTNPSGDRIPGTSPGSIHVRDVSVPPGAKGRPPLETASPITLATGPSALATHHHPSLEPHAGAPSLCDDPRFRAPSPPRYQADMCPRHAPARPRAAQGHHHDGPRGPSFHSPSIGATVSGAPTHYALDTTAHTGRGSEPLPTHPWRPHNPKRFSVSIQGASPLTTNPQQSHNIPKQEAGRANRASRQEQRNQQKNPKTNQSQPRPTASSRQQRRRRHDGAPCAPTAPPNRGRRGWHPLSRAGLFPSCTWGTGGGEPPPIPRIRIPT